MILWECERTELSAFSGSGKLEKQSLSEKIQNKLNDTGVAIVPVPMQLINEKKLEVKVCQQYALEEFAENIVLLDTGYAKIMTPFLNLKSSGRYRGLRMPDILIRMREAGATR